MTTKKIGHALLVASMTSIIWMAAIALKSQTKRTADISAFNAPTVAILNQAMLDIESGQVSTAQRRIYLLKNCYQDNIKNPAITPEKLYHDLISPDLANDSVTAAHMPIRKSEPQSGSPLP